MLRPPFIRAVLNTSPPEREIAVGVSSCRQVMPALSALVVRDALTDALPIVSLLSDWDFHVTVADSFTRAKACLVERPPALLITDLQLGVFNGLGLVLRGRTHRPNLASVVLSHSADPVLQRDAERLGATFICKPLPARELRAAIVRTMFLNSSTDAALVPLRPPFERRMQDRRRGLSAHADQRRVAERRTDAGEALAQLVLVSRINRR